METLPFGLMSVDIIFFSRSKSDNSEHDDVGLV